MVVPEGGRKCGSCGVGRDKNGPATDDRRGVRLILLGALSPLRPIL